ncbi:MAG: hypothetical protein JNM38_13340, partial [Acidobacteria bacterium]|nr:hypothetical protein [Acidobacteriota bacterium]
MKTRLTIAATLGCAILCACRADAGPEQLVSGVSQLWFSGSPGPVYPMSAAWSAVVSGDEDATFPSTIALARDYGAGRVVVLGHDGIFSNYGSVDNAVFLRNTVAWLDRSSGKQVKYSSGHGEWVNGSTLQSLQTDLVGLGYTMGPAASPRAPPGRAGTAV